jgi:cytochrome c2
MALIGLAFAVGCSSAQTTAPSAPAAGGDEAQFVRTKCTMCHTYDRISSASYDEAGWTEVVTRMQQNGMVVTEEEKARIIAFLASQ